MPDFERLLPDVPATFPRPDPALTDAVRRSLIRGAPSPHGRRRLGLGAGLAIAVVAGVGFTAGHWLIPPRGAAATSVSISVRPTIVTAYVEPVTAYGIADGSAGEPVSVEAKECGSYGGFHLVAGTQTGASGAWATDVKAIAPGITTVYRARWKGETSDTVTVRVHPQLFLQRLKGFFALTVRAEDIFRGDVAVVERLSGNRWVRVKRVVIKSFGGYGWGGVARFHARVERGTSVRVVLAQAQVGRCFLPGFSNIVHA